MTPEVLCSTKSKGGGNLHERTGSANVLTSRDFAQLCTSLGESIALGIKSTYFEQFVITCYAVGLSRQSGASSYPVSTTQGALVTMLPNLVR